MLDRCYKHAGFDLDVVTMSGGERFLFQQEASSASFGVFYIFGNTTMIEGAVPGRVFDTVGGWRPNAEHGWSNDVVGHAAMLLEAAPEGVQWICMSRNGTGEREVQHLVVSGSATIPAGWGFVVATGSVTFEGKTADQFAYAKPRTADFEVVGSADLLLVR